MPNYTDNQLDLIQSDQSTLEYFDQRLGHSIRLHVRDKNTNSIKSVLSSHNEIDTYNILMYIDGTNELVPDNISSENFIPIVSQYNEQTSIYENTVSWGDDNGLGSQIKIYRDAESNIFVKPSEILNKNLISTGEYQLDFYMLKDIFYDFYLNSQTWNDLGGLPNPINIINDNTPWLLWNNPRFYISQISPSRTEIRLYGRFGINNTQIPFDSTFQNNFENFIADDGAYNFDYVLRVISGTTEEIYPINNITFDNATSPSNASLIVKINNQLAGNISDYDIAYIEKKLSNKQIQNITFESDIQQTIIGGPLEPDNSFQSSFQNQQDSYQNVEDLMLTASISELDDQQITSDQDFSDINLNVDFEYWDNHVFFSSAEEKLKNFNTKVSEVEDYLSEISSSFSQSGSNVVTQRLNLFEKIKNVKNKFTPYERFLYYDGQNENTASAPGLGRNLFDQNYLENDHNKLLFNYDGFKTVYTGSIPQDPQEDNVCYIIRDNIRIDNPPFFNDSGSYYLSFLMKKTNLDSGSLTLQIPNPNPDSFGLANYPLIPQSTYGRAFIQGRVSSSSDPTSFDPTYITSSVWRRVIIEASQSYWRPSKNTEPDSAGNNSVGDIANITDFTNSSEYEILTGSYILSASLSGSSYDGFAYGIQDTSGQYANLMNPSVISSSYGLLNTHVPRTGSVMPSGFMFPLYWTFDSTNAVAISQSFITDVKITDTNPYETYPFSNIYSTASADYDNWYSSSLSRAQQWDKDNIHSLKNNLPVKVKENDDSDVLIKFLSMIGEQFDNIRDHISNFSTFYKREYTKYNSPPPNILPILADNLGWDVVNPYTGSLADYFSNVSRGSTVKEIAEETWKKVIHNLIYIYKTKGTLNSINALLNSYGYPTNLFNIEEFGNVNENQNPEIITNLGNQKGGLTRTQGNVGYTVDTIPFYSLNLTDLSTGSANYVTGSNQLALDWWTNSVTGSTLEFIFKTRRTSNDQTLVVNSGSAGETLWDLRLLSGNSGSSGSFQFRLNNSLTGSLAIADNAYSMSTNYLSKTHDGDLWNVMLQRSSASKATSGSHNVDQTYTLYVARQDDDRIPEFISSSLELTGSTSGDASLANANFIGTGSRGSTTNGNLIFGTQFTGSVAQIRFWDSILSASKFKQHTLNKFSVVGNTIDESRYQLNYNFSLQENHYYITGSSRTIKDASTIGTPDYSTELLTSASHLNYPLYSVTQIPVVRLTTRNGDIQRNDNKIIIQDKDNDVTMDVNLDPFKRAFKTDLYNPRSNKRTHTTDLKIVRTVTGKVEDYINNLLSDIDISDYWADPHNLYSSSYKSLDDLRKNIYSGVKINATKFIQAQEKTFEPSILNTIKSVLPARATLGNVGVEIRQTQLERSKIKHHEMSIQENYGLHNLQLYLSSSTGNFEGSEYIIPYGTNVLDIASSSFDLSNTSLINPYSTTLNIASSSYDLGGSEYFIPHETNVLNIASESITLFSSKFSPYDTNTLNISSESITLSSTQFSPYDINTLNISSESIDVTLSFIEPYITTISPFAPYYKQTYKDKTITETTSGELSIGSITVGAQPISSMSGQFFEFTGSQNDRVRFYLNGPNTGSTNTPAVEATSSFTVMAAVSSSDSFFITGSDLSTSYQFICRSGSVHDLNSRTGSIPGDTTTVKYFLSSSDRIKTARSASMVINKTFTHVYSDAIGQTVYLTASYSGSDYYKGNSLFVTSSGAGFEWQGSPGKFTGKLSGGKISSSIHYINSGTFEWPDTTEANKQLNVHHIFESASIRIHDLYGGYGNEWISTRVSSQFVSTGSIRITKNSGSLPSFYITGSNMRTPIEFQPATGSGESDLDTTTKVHFLTGSTTTITAVSASQAINRTFDSNYLRASSKSGGYIYLTGSYISNRQGTEIKSDDSNVYAIAGMSTSPSILEFSASHNSTNHNNPIDVGSYIGTSFIVTASAFGTASVSGMTGGVGDVTSSTTLREYEMEKGEYTDYINFEYSSPYNTNILNISSESIELTFNKISPTETNTLNISSESIELTFNKISPYDSNILNIASESLELSSTQFSPYDSNILNIASESVSLSTARFSPYDTNVINLSSESLELSSTQFSPYDFSLNMSSESVSLKNSQLFVPYEGSSSQINNYDIGYWNYNSNLVRSWGSGVNDTWIMHMGASGSDGTYNTGQTKIGDHIIYTIGDFEEISASYPQLTSSNTLYSPIDTEVASKHAMGTHGEITTDHGDVRTMYGEQHIDFNDTRFFSRTPIISDSGSLGSKLTYTHKYYFTDSNGVTRTMDNFKGRLMGRTAYYSSSTNDAGDVTLTYPLNHYRNFPTSKDFGLKYSTYKGSKVEKLTIWNDELGITESRYVGLPEFPAEVGDLFPRWDDTISPFTAQVYTSSVVGAGTTRRIKGDDEGPISEPKLVYKTQNLRRNRNLKKK